MKDYYQLLELTPAASTDEIKRAFRRQIARYHPDKVQHLGHEFQTMAEDRAAELTEAYRILSDAARRSEYDADREAQGLTAPPASAVAPSTATSPESRATDDTKRPPASKSKPSHSEKTGPQFVEERASRDQFVRKATIRRFRQVFEQVAGSGYDESPVRGFELAWAPKTKLFARGKGPRLLGLFVPRVDGAAIANAWVRARELVAGADEEVCVILMGADLAPERELAQAIARQGRRPLSGGKVTLIPVNASVWDAHLPPDAPVVAKNLLARLRSGT